MDKGQPRSAAGASLGLSAPDSLDHSPAGDRSRLPPPQAPRAGAELLAAVRRGARLLSGGGRGAVHGGAAARRRPGRAGAARAAPSASRSRSTSTTVPTSASSFMSVALVSVFKSAMAGTCKGHEELAATALPLEAWLPVGRRARRRRSWRGGCSSRSATRSRRRALELDPEFPEWGADRHLELRLRGELPPRRPAHPPLRAAAGARRRKALLGRRRPRSRS